MNIRINLKYECDFFNDKNDEFSLCSETLLEYFDLGETEDIDLVISDKKTKDSYKVKLRRSYVYFLDIKTEPDAKEYLLGQTGNYISKHLRQLYNKPFYISVEA